MIPTKEVAEIAEKTAVVVEGRLDFLERFLGRKYGGVILFVVTVAASFAYADYKKTEGIDEGKANAYQVYRSQIVSLQHDSIAKSTAISEKKTEIKALEKQLSSCENDNSIENMNRKVLNALDEAERMKKLMEQKIYNDKKFNQNLKSLQNPKQ